MGNIMLACIYMHASIDLSSWKLDLTQKLQAMIAKFVAYDDIVECSLALFLTWMHKFRRKKISLYFMRRKNFQQIQIEF